MNLFDSIHSDCQKFTVGSWVEFEKHLDLVGKNYSSVTGYQNGSSIVVYVMPIT